MKIRRVGMLLLAAALLFTGCNRISNREMQIEHNEYTFNAYYLNENSYMVPVSMNCDRVVTPQIALEYLSNQNPNAVDQFEDYGLLAPITDDMKVTLSVTGTTAAVDIANFQPKNGNVEYGTILCIANTLLDCEEVNEVTFTFYGKPAERLTYGTDVSAPFTAIQYLPENASVSKVASSIHLYFIDADGGQIVPITRYITAKPTLAMILQEFITGPEAGMNLTNGLPANVKLLSSKVEGDTATLNFSKELENMMEQPELEEKVKKVIAMNCENLPEIKKVIIQVEGKEYFVYNKEEGTAQ